jgi:small subunit ribosomal protein S9
LNDEPQNDAPQDDAPEEQTPQAETPEEETPAAEERPTPAQDPGSTEDPTPAEPTPGPQEGEEQPEPSPAQDPDEETPEPESGGSAGEAEQPPENVAPEQETAPDAKPEESAKKGEAAIPGAELDPIAISDEGDLSAEERARREAEAEERARRDAEATAEARDEPAAASIKPADLAKDARYSATGKRKNSVARVIVKPGGGAIVVNGRPLEEYFPRPQLQTIAKQSLVTSGYEGTVDVVARAHGGGISGQAAAVRHGIAKALTEIDPNLRPELKKRGLLTRDARVKERRKAGLKKARKKPQFSKR